MFFLFAFTTEDNPTIGIIGFYGFMLAFLVFFILGWVVKDKPIVPKNSSTETNDKTSLNNALPPPESGGGFILSAKTNRSEIHSGLFYPR